MQLGARLQYGRHEKSSGYQESEGYGIPGYGGGGSDVSGYGVVVSYGAGEYGVSGYEVVVSYGGYDVGGYGVVVSSSGKIVGRVIGGKV